MFGANLVRIWLVDGTLFLCFCIKICKGFSGEWVSYQIVGVEGLFLMYKKVEAVLEKFMIFGWTLIKIRILIA